MVFGFFSRYMEMIYQNKYGATFKVANVPNPKCSLQLVVDSIGLFMTEADLATLLNIIQQSGEPCYCENCQGEKCQRLWCSSRYYEFGLTLDPENTKELVDLIKGTQFLLNMDETLEKYRIS